MNVSVVQDAYVWESTSKYDTICQLAF